MRRQRSLQAQPPSCLCKSSSARALRIPGSARTNKRPILHLVTRLGAHRQRALQAQPPDLLREPVRVRAHHRAKDDPAAAHLRAGGPELAPGQITNNSRGTVVSVPSARHFVHRVRKSAGPGLPYDGSLRLCKR
jgi:hypothetical protein